MFVFVETAVLHTGVSIFGTDVATGGTGLASSVLLVWLISHRFMVNNNFLALPWEPILVLNSLTIGTGFDPPEIEVGKMFVFVETSVVHTDVSISGAEFATGATGLTSSALLVWLIPDRLMVNNDFLALVWDGTDILDC